MSVAKLLPKLKTLLVFPADHDKMLQIQFLLTQLLNDTDRDVLSCAKDANKQIETNKVTKIYYINGSIAFTFRILLYIIYIV